MPRLEIWLIGGSVGESLVLRTPGGEWGVMDAYAANPNDPRTNPTLSMLRDLGVRELRFVGMSHPHMDHYSGLRGILDAYSGRVREFWRPPFGPQDWKRLVARLAQTCAHLARSYERKLAAAGIMEFRKLLDLVSSERERHGLHPVGVQERTRLLDEPAHDFEVRCLAPSSALTEAYFEKLAEKVVRSESHWVSGEHNLVSSVLEVRYRKWRGILGGDAERRTWATMQSYCDRDLVARLRFLKIAHHGSAIGHPSPFWVAPQRTPLHAALTSFRAQGLPTSQGIELYRHRSVQLHATNKRLAMATGAHPVPVALTGLARVDPMGEVGEVRIRVDAAGRTTVEHRGQAGSVSSCGPVASGQSS